MGADVGLHPPGNRVDADHRLPGGTRLRSLQRRGTAGARRPTGGRASRRAWRSRKRTSRCGRAGSRRPRRREAVSERRVASSSLPEACAQYQHVSLHAANPTRGMVRSNRLAARDLGRDPWRPRRSDARFPLRPGRRTRLRCDVTMSRRARNGAIGLPRTHLSCRPRRTAA